MTDSFLFEPDENQQLELKKLETPSELEHWKILTLVKSGAVKLQVVNPYKCELILSARPTMKFSDCLPLPMFAYQYLKK